MIKIVSFEIIRKKVKEFTDLLIQVHEGSHERFFGLNHLTCQ
ncbi:MAG: hypothetical protein YK1309IOTA_400009 [Marine Group I thaumarchaeote]|nr:MAG: hypothetical protein YK1309IOTA_400009 [Marine Group I thaumarchaeote]